MSEFKREERYIVVKLKHLIPEEISGVKEFLRSNDIDTVECVVVERHWPEHELVWDMIAARVEGRPTELAMAEERAKKLLDALVFAQSKLKAIIRSSFSVARTALATEGVQNIATAIKANGQNYYAPDGTLMNADGTRSIFDDVDQ